MTSREEEEFVMKLMVIAKIVDKPMTKDMMKVYYELAKPHGIEKANLALNELMVELRPGQSLPMPRQLLEKICPVVDDMDQAKEAAARIREAISRFGYVNPKAAEKFIGSLGWYVVGRFGGWAAVCETPKSENTNFQAQARELAISAIRRHKAGVQDQAPQLPESKFKQLEERKEQKQLSEHKVLRHPQD